MIVDVFRLWHKRSKPMYLTIDRLIGRSNNQWPSNSRKLVRVCAQRKRVLVHNKEMMLQYSFSFLSRYANAMGMVWYHMVTGTIPYSDACTRSSGRSYNRITLTSVHHWSVGVHFLATERDERMRHLRCL